MSHITTTYHKVLKQAQRLPLYAQRQLAEALLRTFNAKAQTVFVSLTRFRQDTQVRFQELMDRNNEGQLTPSERDELEGLVARYQAMLLRNTEALLKSNCPELFNASGRLIRRRLERTLRDRRIVTTD